MSVYDTLKIPEGEEIEHKTISNFVEKAQKKIEGNNFAIRKNLLEYDRVNNEQREIITRSVDEFLTARTCTRLSSR